MKIKMNPANRNLESFLLECAVKGLQTVSIDSYRQKIETILKKYELTQAGIDQFIVDYRKTGRHKYPLEE